MRFNFLKNKVALAIAGAGVLIIVLISVLLYLHQETTLDFSVVDARSRSWVYNLTAHLQDRALRGFKTVTYSFRNLKPGKWEMTLAAPSYEGKTVTVALFPGRNSIAHPVELSGYEIKDLAGFSVFERIKDNELTLDIRLVRKDGEAVRDHPCIDLVIMTRISEQLIDGKSGLEESAGQATRGEVLYSGKADWKWSSQLTEVYRYSGSIPLSRIRTGVSPYWIVDYVFILPDPRKITAQEIEKLLEEAPNVNSLAMIEALFEKYRGRLVWFFNSKTNVEGK